MRVTYRSRCLCRRKREGIVLLRLLWLIRLLRFGRVRRQGRRRAGGTRLHLRAGCLIARVSARRWGDGWCGRRSRRRLRADDAQAELDEARYEGGGRVLFAFLGALAGLVDCAHAGQSFLSRSLPATPLENAPRSSQEMIDVWLLG